MKRADIATTLQNLLGGLYYISESERPVELLTWDISSDEALRSRIAAFTGQAAGALLEGESAAFFEAVQRMADPNDDAMMVYARRYTALHDFLRENLAELKVIRSGRVEVHIFIVGFTQEEHQAIVLHTIAVQT